MLNARFHQDVFDKGRHTALFLGQRGDGEPILGAG